MGDQPRLLSLVCPPRINRAARVRALLAGERVEADSAEAVWGYRLRHHHVGTVCGVGGEEAGGGALVRLEQATREVAAQAGCEGRPLFVPRDECSAGAWLPPTPSPFQRCAPVLPETQRYPVRLGCAGALASPASAAPTGRPWAPTRWGRAAGPSGPRLTSYTEVAPLALMSSSVELLWTWMQEILGQLADDDDQHARLRDTLRVFLQENGSFKATAERLILHKNSVQYGVRKAEEALGHPVDDNRLHVELALLASQWLGATVLRHPGQPSQNSGRTAGPWPFTLTPVATGRQVRYGGGGQP